MNGLLRVATRTSENDNTNDKKSRSRQYTKSTSRRAQQHCSAVLRAHKWVGKKRKFREL